VDSGGWLLTGGNGVTKGGEWTGCEANEGLFSTIRLLGVTRVAEVGEVSQMRFVEGCAERRVDATTDII